MKRCIACGRSLPLSEFYRHPMMADGRLGKCKECQKANTNKNYWEHREERLAYYRVRGKSAKRKAYDAERQRRRRQKEPEKYRAWAAVAYALRKGTLTKGPCEVCGATEKVQAHHDDYSRPLAVVWLCVTCHNVNAHGRGVSPLPSLPR